ncbi:hypothetical protein ACVI8K_008876 [Bradyrhizobium barranii subsp. barranii]
MTTTNWLGAAAIGCVVMGAGWTIYSNVFGASVYPTVGSLGYDEPVIKRAPRVALREAGEAIGDTFALLPDRLQVAAPISREMFNERFAAAATQGVASNAASAAPATQVAVVKDAPKQSVIAKVADALKPAAPAKIADKTADKAKRAPDAQMQLASADPAEIVPAPEARPKSFADRAKAAVMSITGPRQSMVEKLWGKREPSGGLLAYASADASVTASIAPREQNPMLGGSAPYERDTAVYDITAKMVYLPDGTKLEAHSGLGSQSRRSALLARPHARRDAAAHLHAEAARSAVPWRAGAAPDPDRRRERDLRPRRPARPHLHARAERRFQRLRVVQGLLRVPRRLP